jgi:hypothetical protein
MSKFNCTKTINYFFPCPQIIWEECHEDDQIDLCPMSGAASPPCPIWSCFRKKQPTTQFNIWILIAILMTILFFLLLLGVVLWKCRKNRRQTEYSISYRPLKGYRERLLDGYPKYVLPENYEVEIDQRKKPE